MGLFGGKKKKEPSNFEFRLVNRYEKDAFFEIIKQQGWGELEPPFEFDKNWDKDRIRRSAKAYALKLGADMLVEIEDPSFSSNIYNDLVFYVFKRDPYFQQPEQYYPVGQGSVPPARECYPPEQQQPSYPTSNQPNQQNPGQNPQFDPRAQQMQQQDPQANPYEQHYYDQQHPRNPENHPPQGYPDQSQNQYGQYPPQQGYPDQSQDPYGQYPQQGHTGQPDPYGQYPPQQGYPDQSQDPYGQYPPQGHPGQPQDPYGQYPPQGHPGQPDPYGQYPPGYPPEAMGEWQQEPEMPYQPDEDGKIKVTNTKELSLKNHYSSHEEAFLHTLDNMSKMLSMPNSPFQFRDNREFLHPTVRIQKGAYIYLSTRQMDLVLMKEAVNDYKIMGNETHGTSNVNSMRDTLVVIKTLGTPTFQILKDYEELDEQAKGDITQSLFGYMECFLPKM